MHLRSPTGETTALGGYSFKGARWTTEIAIPHLLRVAPSGSWIASFDVAASRIELRSTTNDVPTRRVQVEGLDPDVPISGFRWLGKGEGIAIATSWNVFVGFFDPASPSATLKLRPIFTWQGRKQLIRDMRTVETGIVVRHSEPWVKGTVHSPQSVSFIPVKASTVGKMQSIAKETYKIKSISVLTDGRFVVVVSRAPKEHNLKRSRQLWTYSTADGQLRKTRIDKLRYQREILNWASGSSTPAFAAKRRVDDSSRTVLSLPLEESRKHRKEVSLPEHWEAWDGIPVLWANDDETRFLIGGLHELGLWSAKGKRLKIWKAPGRRQVHSAHFSKDGGVTVAAGLSVYSIQKGKGRRLFSAAGRYKERKSGQWQERHSSISDLVALPDGSIAYSVVSMRGGE